MRRLCGFIPVLTALTLVFLVPPVALSGAQDPTAADSGSGAIDQISPPLGEFAPVVAANQQVYHSVPVDIPRTFGPTGSTGGLSHLTEWETDESVWKL